MKKFLSRALIPAYPALVFLVYFALKQFVLHGPKPAQFQMFPAGRILRYFITYLLGALCMLPALVPTRGQRARRVDVPLLVAALALFPLFILCYYLRFGPAQWGVAFRDFLLFMAGCLLPMAFVPVERNARLRRYVALLSPIVAYTAFDILSLSMARFHELMLVLALLYIALHICMALEGVSAARWAGFRTGDHARKMPVLITACALCALALAYLASVLWRTLSGGQLGIVLGTFLAIYPEVIAIPCGLGGFYAAWAFLLLRSPSQAEAQQHEV